MPPRPIDLIGATLLAIVLVGLVVVLVVANIRRRRGVSRERCRNAPTTPDVYAGTGPAGNPLRR